MDDQIQLLSREIKAVEHRISSQISDLDKSVRALQIADGAKSATEHRLKVAENEIHMLFSNQRTMEEKYDDKLDAINTMISSKIAFWKGAAWLASGGAALLLVLIDIALRLLK